MKVYCHVGKVVLGQGRQFQNEIFLKFITAHTPHSRWPHAWLKRYEYEKIAHLNVNVWCLTRLSGNYRFNWRCGCIVSANVTQCYGVPFFYFSSANLLINPHEEICCDFIIALRGVGTKWIDWCFYRRNTYWSSASGW